MYVLFVCFLSLIVFEASASDVATSAGEVNRWTSSGWHLSAPSYPELAAKKKKCCDYCLPEGEQKVEIINLDPVVVRGEAKNFGLERGGECVFTRLSHSGTTSQTSLLCDNPIDTSPTEIRTQCPISAKIVENFERVLGSALILEMESKSAVDFEKREQTLRQLVGCSLELQKLGFKSDVLKKQAVSKGWADERRWNILVKDFYSIKSRFEEEEEE